MDVQLVRPRPFPSSVTRSSGVVSQAEPEKLEADDYRPRHPGKTLARVGGWTLPVAGGVLAYIAASSANPWAGAAVGAPVGLAVGLAIGGAADLMKSFGGSSRGVGRATVLGTLIGGAITGGLSAWLVGSGVGWGIPVMAGVGVLQGAALGGLVHLLTRPRETETQRLVEQINLDPAKYNAPKAKPYLDAIHDLEKRGWDVSGHTLLDYQVKPDPNLTVSVSDKSGYSNDIPIEQLPTLIKVLNGEQDSLPRPELFQRLADRPLISQARAATMPYGGIPSAESKSWWQVERTRAYHDLKDGKALHYAHREITFTYDPANPPPLDEFIQDAQKTADAYEQAFRSTIESYKLDSTQGQALCNTMVRLAEEKRFPDLASAGQAMARWASQSEGSSGENTKALLSLLSPQRPPETLALMDTMVKNFGLVETARAADYLSTRLPLLGPTEQAGAPDRFIRLAGSLGEVEQAVRVDGILGAMSAPVYDHYLGVCEQLAEKGGERKPKDLLLDFAMLGAYAQNPQDLQNHVQAFSQLLEPLAATNQADQAAPVYAFLKSHNLSPDSFLTALEQTKDARAACQQLVPTPPGAVSTAVVDEKSFEPVLGYSARQAVEHLEQERGRLDAPGFERYQKTFTRVLNASADLEVARRASGVLQNLPPGRAEVHLGVLEDLTRRRGEASPSVLVDYLCTVTGRLPGQSLQDAAREYGDLLGGCAGAGPGLADEAAPTFALIRDGIASGKAGKDTVRDLTDRYLKSLLLTKDGEKSRHLIFTGEAHSSVQEDQSGVTVGGVRIRRRPGARGE